MFRTFMRRLLHSNRPKICEDVGEWAKSRGAICNFLRPPVLEKIQAIAEMDSTARQELRVHYAELARPQELTVVSKARIRDSIGLVFLPDGKVCQQGNWFRPFLEAHPSYKARFRESRYLRGPIYSLISLWSSEYYHWFHDVLPRLIPALPLLPKDTKFLIQKSPKEFQLKSLQALGIDESRLEIQLDRGETVVEELWLATPLGHSTFTDGVVLRELRRLLLDKFSTAERCGKPNKRVFVTRRNANSRRVKNESEISGTLTDLGFEIIAFEQLSFVDQLSLAHDASVLIGPHGAGLMNLLFVRPGTFVGEICTAGVFPHYFAMAHQLGLPFARFHAESVNQKTGDMFVNAKLFTEWLIKNCPL